jgi:CRISPR/Cas system-associated exonuclease Cas4 (RecB family)
MGLIFKPLKDVIDIDAIKRVMLSMSINDLIDYLLTKNIVIWTINVSGKKLFVAKDFEMQHKNYIGASQLGQRDILSFYFNIKHGVKLYNENDLYKIVFGFLVHEAYQGILMLSLMNVKNEVKVIDPDLGIVGIADFVSDDAVIEIKSGRKTKNHLLQLGAYLKALKKEKGYIIYQNDVIEVRYNDNLRQQLYDAVIKFKRLREFILMHDIKDIIARFKYESEKFRERFGVKPLELVEILRSRGFI